MPHHIHRLVIKNYRGVALLQQDIPERGAIIKGGNARGKTSVLRAIRAALAARDIGPDAIHVGEERAEILVDIGALSVHRTITASGSTLKVRNDEGDTKSKPQTVLNDLLGTAPLDPIDLYMERDKKKRRALVLAALPVRVTEAHLQRWIPVEIRSTYPIALPDLTQHGLEVVAEVREAVAAIRKQANADHKLDKARLSQADERLEKLPPIDGAPELGAAEAAVTEASQALGDLRAAERRAAAQEERTRDTRARIAKMHEEASSYDAAAAALTNTDLAPVEAEIETLEAERDALQRAIDDKTRAILDAKRKREQVVASIDAKRTHEQTAAKRRIAAADLEAVLAAIEPRPTPEAIAQAEQRVAAAEGRRNLARQAAERAAALADRAKLEAAEREASNRAGQLSAVVDTLTKTAPAELLAEAKGIEGLTLVDDEIALNGVTMDALCGKEQLAFAVEIARRVNERARVLIVDGLERLDPDELPGFIREATRDGYQLIATRVDRGDVVIEAITLDDEAAAAE